MTTGEKLPLDLTWQPDGHVSEVALAMMADGEQDLLAAGAAEHVEACDACSVRLGAAAMISLRVTEELPAIAARHALVEARTESLAAIDVAPVTPSRLAARAMIKPAGRPLPARAIAAALLVAVIGALPSLLVELPRLPSFFSSVLKMVPVVGRAAIAQVQGYLSGASGPAPALTWLSAVLFLITGLALARSMSRGRSLQGEVG
jgi:hypothetical protein